MWKLVKSLNWALFAILVVLAIGRLIAVSRETAPLEVIKPPEGRLVQAGRDSIFLLEEGPADGPMLLFAHGTAAWSGLWEPTLRALGTKDWRAVGFDMPPFGFSGHAADGDYSRTAQADRILRLVETFESKPIMVAHSIGAGPAVEAVMKDQSAFAGLVVVDGALGLNGHEQGKTLLLPLRFKIIREAVTALSLTNPLATRFFLRGLIHVKEAASDEVVSVLQMPLARQGTTAAYAAWVPSLLVPPKDARSTRPEAYQNLTLPVVYIWGEQDTVTPLEQGQELGAITPGSQLLVIKGVGHIPQIEDPEAFLLALERALGLISSSDLN
ncbi:MAG: alpha/beta hydrolase [Pseudomonadota bacterium]